MKFTTDIERYYFACAKKNHNEDMMHYVHNKAEELKSERSQKAKDKRSEYIEEYHLYLAKVNFWCHVRDYFEKRVDFGKGMFFYEGCLFVR